MVADQLGMHGESAAAAQSYRRALTCAGLAEARPSDPQPISRMAALFAPRGDKRLLGATAQSDSA